MTKKNTENNSEEPIKNTPNENQMLTNMALIILQF